MCFFSIKSIFFRGALTSKPYAFLARPWEFRSVDSIDVFDSLGSNIRVDVRGDKILRILPRSNDLINSDWISDKVRFICDAIRLQRVDTPILKALDSFYLLNWNQVFGLWSLISLFSNSFIDFKALKHLGVGYSKNLNPLLVLGLYLDLESSSVLSRISHSFFYNSNSLSELIGNANLMVRSNFLFNQSLSSLQAFDSIILVDCNLKIEAPVLSIYLRNLAKSGVKFYSFGKALSSSSHSFIQNLGSVFNFFELLKGKHWFSRRLLKTNSFFLFDEKIFNSKLVTPLFNSLNLKFGVFYNNLANLNALENCLKTNTKFDRFSSSIQFLTNLSSSGVSNSLFFLNKKLLKTSASLGLISHGGLLANSLDVLVPVSSSFEHSKSYLNTLGLIQKTRLALTSPNSVLDCSNVLVFYYLFLLRAKLESLNDLTKKNLLLFSFLGFFNSLVLNSLKSWEYVSFFFQLVESNSLLFSTLFNYFSTINFDFKKLKINEELLLSRNNAFVMPTKVFNVGLSGLKLTSAVDFYQNDEIALISSTLAAASKRLVDKHSFI